MTDLMGDAGPSRRWVLRVGLGAVLAAPVVAACTSDPPAPPQPDPLAELASRARADAAFAEAVAAAVPELA
ncbi:MAG TPA: DUF4439 domain-containing protein, partial [Actinophytocola sp.]|nr:DUF4439 domain-containing protein [Actinophytocola sp.]